MKKRPDQWAVLVIGAITALAVWFWPQPPLPEGVEVEQHPLVLGPSDKPALTIFSWWGCPHCQQMWERKGPRLIQRAMNGEIRLVYRPIARTRAEALVSGLLYCLPPEKAFQQIEDYFGFSRLAELALRERQEVQPYLACVDSPGTLSRLAADSQAIERWAIQHSPTLFEAGRRVPPEEMEQVLAAWAQQPLSSLCREGRRGHLN